MATLESGDRVYFDGNSTRVAQDDPLVLIRGADRSGRKPEEAMTFSQFKEQEGVVLSSHKTMRRIGRKYRHGYKVTVVGATD